MKTKGMLSKSVSFPVNSRGDEVVVMLEKEEDAEQTMLEAMHHYASVAAWLEKQPDDPILTEDELITVYKEMKASSPKLFAIFMVLATSGMLVYFNINERGKCMTFVPDSLIEKVTSKLL